MLLLMETIIIQAQRKSHWQVYKKHSVKAEPGYTIIIQKGTYYPTSTINITKSGTAAEPIFIIGDPAGAPVFGSATRQMLPT